jgi:hypothetical protein
VIVSSEPQRKILRFGLRLSGLRTQAPDCATADAATQAHNERTIPAPQTYAAVAAAARMLPPRPTGADLQAKLDAARMRLHEIVILRIKTWLPAETLKETARGRSVPTRGVSLHFQVMECFRERQAEQHFAL